MWDLEHSRLVGRIGPAARAYKASAAGLTRLITIEDKPTARLWNLTTGAVLETIADRLLDVEPQAGRYVTYDNTLAVTSTIDGREIARLDIPNVVYARLVRGTDRVLVLQDLAQQHEAWLTLWNLENRERVGLLLRGQRTRYVVEQIDQDVITLRFGNRTWSWQGTTGEELTTPVEEPLAESGRASHKLGIRKTVQRRSLLVSGTRVIAVSLLEVAQHYQTLPPLIEHAKRSVARALTPEERLRYNIDPTPPSWYVEMKKWPTGRAPGPTGWRQVPAVRTLSYRRREATRWLRR